MTGAFLVRVLISAVIIALIALIGRRWPGLGGVIASVPLVSTLGMIWLWHDTQDRELVASYATAAFWYFLPTIPMFLLIPALLRNGTSFWVSLAAGLGLTVILYLLTAALLARFDVRI
ncbi:MAG TPA: DUF3147 family protein [Allosphingosinicella sp.]|nr:DUF3147 family protein [Allosphingosinicella sp.]